MQHASIELWASCPECGHGLEFKGYREEPLVCTSIKCTFTETDSTWKSFTDFMSCPRCESSSVSARGGGYRENGVFCESCGLEEDEFFGEAPDDT